MLLGFAADGSPDWLRDAGLLIEDGQVREIGDGPALARAHADAAALGGRGFVAIPGLINAHHHVGLTPFQLGSPDHPLELWFASRLGLRDVDMRLDTLYSAFEMIASGVTTVQHLHSRVPGGLDAVLATAERVIGAYGEIGMRASYSFALRDQNRLVYEADEAFLARIPPELRPGLAAYFARFAQPLSDQIEVFRELRRRYADNGRIAIQIAPSNLHWLSDAALASAAEIAAETGAPMHMHLLETPYQKAYALKRTGGSALAHIHRFGLTGPHLTLGHGVWMSEEDMEICAHTGTRICHNCSSNLRLKSGTAPVNRFRAHGIPVALGIDEAGINDDRDMLQEMRLALRLHRQPGIDSSQPSAADVLRMATEHGAGTTPFGNYIGQLRPGSAADIVLLDWDRLVYPYQDPDLALQDVLVYRAQRECVDTVVVGGEVIYTKGTFTRIDRAETLAEIHRRLKVTPTSEELDRRRLAAQLLPHVRAFYDGYIDGLL
ncbi:cytosine/adenosine deaminase-related metal-dependent hydrolase [Angulomicrobium tetraedrale]|uniref:Cytosine/adenosine deaminase-related metal-dependent hydrolase n=1 Tax=Ancylobacter tetraedralis TaxID=217068 RepID=A0A839Z442_9HYPH|nr:cytosine/adenosine deaminase-related metal-dependent hydrolase [Ancylobacter tetraedralis]